MLGLMIGNDDAMHEAVTHAEGGRVYNERRYVFGFIYISADIQISFVCYNMYWVLCFTRTWNSDYSWVHILLPAANLKILSSGYFSYI